MAYRLFQFGATGRGIYVDENGSLVISNDPNASGYIVGYGDEGHPLLVDASGRLLVQNDSPTTSLAALSDTDTIGAVSGQFLMYDSASTDWIPSDVTLAVEDLSNAVISTPTSGEALVYNGSSWVNSPVAASGGSAVYDVVLVTASGQNYSATKSKTYSVDMSGGDVTIDLPSSSATNDYVIVKDKGNSQVNVLTVSAASGDSIDGQGSIVISSNYAALTLVWDSTEWIIL